MRKILIAFSFVVVSSFCSTLHAQSQSQFSGWFAMFNTTKLGKKTSLLNDVQLRSTDDFKQLSTLLARTGFQYSLTKKLGLTLGLASIDNRRTFNGTTGYLTEYRIWQQLIYTHKTGPVLVQHRLRNEQRFIPNASVENGELKRDGSSNAYRLRYFIRNIIPLTDRTRPYTKGAFAALQNEVFINTGNKSAVNGKSFDQNRLYFAGGYRLNAKLDLEAGYMYQYIQGRAGASTHNHIVQIATYLRL